MAVVQKPLEVTHSNGKIVSDFSHWEAQKVVFVEIYWKMSICNMFWIVKNVCDTVNYKNLFIFFIWLSFFGVNFNKLLQTNPLEI